MEQMNSFLRSMFNKFVKSQVALSKRFDQLLPSKYWVDGNTHFNQKFIRPYLKEGTTLYDVGGGKVPLLTIEEKTRLNIRVIGLDVDANELRKAPQGAYDSMICADITAFQGYEDADYVVCQALLEHVRNNQAAMASIASILKPNGVALLFIPSRNSVYARINLLLPEKLKKKILFLIYPHTKNTQGFPCFYDRCTPSSIEALAANNNLTVEHEEYYYTCSYFSFLFPLHLLLRSWTYIFYLVAKERSAETFSIALRKQISNSTFYKKALHAL